jgi:transposase
MVIPFAEEIGDGGRAMMGRQRRDQGKLFYAFRLDDRIPKNHLLRRIDVFVTAALADLHNELEPYYSEIGRPSVDPELMIRMLIVGYCCGIRSERRLTQEVELHLAYRWFCKLDLEDEVPHHSTFSLNRLGRFRESDLLRHVFERVVWSAMAMGLVKGEGFAVDASVLEANASRYHGKALAELDWSEKQRQTRAVAEYLAALDEAAEPNPDRTMPKVISPSDPSSAWTAKANKRVQFGYGLNYLIDTENAVITLNGKEYKVHLDGYNQMDMLSKGAKSAREEVWYFTESTLAAVRIGDYKYVFIDQPQGWFGPKVKLDWPGIYNLRLDPFEKMNIGESLFAANWWANEFWRFVFVQQQVAKLGQTAIDFPPMQPSASFNLSAVKEEIDKAITSRTGQ